MDTNDSADHLSLSGLGDNRLGDGADSIDDQLVQVVEDYVAALERGDAEPIDVYAQRHSEFGDELTEYLEGVRVLFDAVESARDAEARDVEPGVSGQLPLDASRLPSGAADGSLLADQSQKPPKVVGGYQIAREIGRGGMGVVYEAEELSLRRRVALKVLPFAAVLDQRQIARFRNEAQAAAALHHPNIVPVFSIGQDHGVHFYAMQHIDGQSLSQAIAELRRGSGGRVSPDATTVQVGNRREEPSAPLTSCRETLGENPTEPEFLRTAARLMADAADALQHAHEQGVVHRDIKPSNLLIDQRGKVWVTDFGLARVHSDLGVTATGDVVGTLRYMSPEQARGQADRIDGRTDVFALGATLYELITLRPSCPGEDRVRLLEQLERSDPTPPRRFNPSVPADLENIVLRALEKDRDSRYASAADLRDDLRRFLEGRPTIARPPRIVDRVGKWARRRRRTVATAAAALVLVAGVSLASVLLVNSARQRLAVALAESETHHARAERLLDQARGVLDRFGGDLSDQLASIPGAELVRARALNDTLAYYQGFLDESDDDPQLALSSAQTRVRAAAVAERLGRRDEAVTLYEEATASLERLASGSPGAEGPTEWLARCLNNYGMLLAGHDAERSETHLRHAIELRRDLVASRPQESAPKADLASVLSDYATIDTVAPDVARRNLEEAIALLQRASLASGADSSLTRRLAIARNSLASRLRVSDPEEAVGHSDIAIELLTSIAASEPEVDPYRADLAMALSNRGALAADAGDWSAAAQSYDAAAAELARLAWRAPLAPRHRSELAVALASKGAALARNGRYAASEMAFDQAGRTLQVLAASYPGSTRYARSLAALWNNRGVVMRDSGRLNEAAVAFATAVRLEEERLDGVDHPVETHLATHYANQVQLLGKLGRIEEAADVETKRLALLSKSDTDGGP